MKHVLIVNYERQRRALPPKGRRLRQRPLGGKWRGIPKKI
ncbi:hypothetical protein RintRC_2781 [Richelia intracellularis]|nr:hypothetical protein RintRC_2781 [Richelia intracellularis]